MKKNTKRIVIALIVAVVAVGIAWGIKLYLREKDPRWQAAKEIYKVQTAKQIFTVHTMIPSLFKKSASCVRVLWSRIFTLLSLMP